MVPDCIGCLRETDGREREIHPIIGDGAHSAGRERWSVTATAKFDLKGSTSSNSSDVVHPMALRKAWTLLRFRHPSIAAKVTQDGRLVYVVPDEPAKLEQWLDDNFFVINGNSVDASEAIATFKPAPVTTLHFLTDKSQIIIHTAHWRTVGYGALLLVDALFSALTSINSGPTDPLAWGSETARLTPSLESLLNLPYEVSPDHHDAAKCYLATEAAAIGTVGLLSPPPLGDAVSWPLRRTRHIQLTLPAETTRRLDTAYSSLGTSLYSVVHAAVAATNYAKVPPSEKSRHFASTIRLNRLNLRPHCARATASGPYTGGYLSKVPPDQSLVERTIAYEAEYSCGVTHEFLMSRRRYAELALAYLRTITGGGPLLNSNMDVSFVCDVDNMVTRLTRSWVARERLT